MISESENSAGKASGLIPQRDAAWWYKINGALRYGTVYGLTNRSPETVVLTEFPKSGGTWLSQMMSHVLDIPYPRNRLPHRGGQIIHGCYLRVNDGIDTVVVWRDGRDTMVSYYYHTMFDNDLNSPRANEKLRRKLGITDPHDITAALPRFIEWSFSGGYPRYSWSDFVRRWHGREGPVFTSYEAVSEDPGRELRRVLDHFGRREYDDAEIEAAVEEFSFERQSKGRKRGEEDVTSFVRKGIVGDWRNVFDRECRQTFARFGGEELVLLGYEADDSWVG